MWGENMAKMYSKLFRKDETIKFIEYTPGYSYLKFVEECREQGFIQIILHSKLILDFCEELLKSEYLIRDIGIDENSFINIEDLKLENINSQSKLEELRKDLYFNDNNYIEIKSIAIEQPTYDVFFELKSNGILIVPQEENQKVVSQLEKLLYNLFMKRK